VTWLQRVEAVGVIVAALAGMTLGAAAAVGVFPVTPPQVVVSILALLVIAKAAAAASGTVAFVVARP